MYHYLLRSMLEKRQIILMHPERLADGAFRKRVFDVAVEATTKAQGVYRRLVDFADIMENVATLLCERYGFTRVEFADGFTHMGFCGPGLLGPDRLRWATTDEDKHPFGDAGRLADDLSDWLRAHNLRNAANAEDLKVQLDVVTEGEKAMRLYLAHGVQVVIEPVDRVGVKRQNIQIIAERPFYTRRADDIRKDD